VKRCLADTGGLVALLDRADLHHSWAVDCFKILTPPLITCEGVFAETLHLLADLPQSVAALARLHRDGILRVDFEFKAHASAVWRLIHKYGDLPMDFADACLVRMSELHSDPLLWTTDSHFRIYRRHGRQTIPLLHPSTAKV
jgi:predicted nucleic acid-binding protein